MTVEVISPNEKKQTYKISSLNKTFHEITNKT